MSCICHTMRASHAHCTHYADMRAFYEHQSFARTFFPFLRTPALRAVASIAEYWRGPTCSLHAHNTCCMRAIRSLQAFFKGLHHYYTLHRLSVQIEVPSRGSISKKKLVCLYKFGMIFFRWMFSTTYLKMR